MYIAERLREENLLKSPEEYIEFLNNPESEKSLLMIYDLFKLETKEETNV
jgi:hypothetical protein